LIQYDLIHLNIKEKNEYHILNSLDVLHNVLFRCLF